MNPRYRKQRRLRSRHTRRGHTPWCQCPEYWDRLVLALRRWQREHNSLPRRRVRYRGLDS